MVGAVLAQEFDGREKVMQYLCHQLGKGQQKWPTTERERYYVTFYWDIVLRYVVTEVVGPPEDI